MLLYIVQLASLGTGLKSLHPATRKQLKLANPKSLVRIYASVANRGPETTGAVDS